MNLEIYNLKNQLISKSAHLLIILLITTSVFSQSPQLMSYQAVIRDATGHLVTTQVGMRISILQGAFDGDPVYTETHFPLPNENGIVTVEIGSGTTTDDFASIDWVTGIYFIKTETDINPGDGSNYTIIAASQLLSVPFALHANTVTYEMQNLSDVLLQGTDAGDKAIVNVSKLGVGTSMPEDQIHFKSTSGITVLLEADSDNSGVEDNPRIKFVQDGGIVSGGLGFTGTAGGIYSGSNSNAMYFVNDYNSSLQLGTNNISRITVNENGTVDVGNNPLTNLADPIDFQDVVTKSYVDEYKAIINALVRLSDPLDLLAEGTSISELLEAGVTVSDLLIAGVSVSELYAGGISVSDLLAEGLTVSDLLAGGISISNLFNGGVTVSELHAAGLTAFELFAGGISVYELLAEEFTVPELLTAGLSISDLFAGGVTISELLAAGVTILELFNANIGVGTMEQNGVTEQALIDAGLIGTLTDIEGNEYKWVKIGTQVWMAENLKTTKYNDNTDIPLVTVNTTWASSNTSAYCWYNNDEAVNKDTYGALYNWWVVNTEINGNKNVCPAGWHVPTAAEWTTLTDFLGGNNVAGGKLKEIGLDHWFYSGGYVTNESAFTALPGGFRYSSGQFFDIRFYGYWWEAQTTTNINPYFWLMQTSSPGIYRQINNPTNGRSVRCLKN